MARPTARVLALLDVLQGGGTHQVARLAERLQVDQRTVRRYVQHLIDLDIPVESVRGRYGGYRLAPGHRMPPLMLTDDEALAVLLGLVSGRTRHHPTAADTAAAKIRRVLPRKLAHRLDALLETTSFTAAAAPVIPPETRVLLTLAEAARHHHPVTISYLDRHHRTSRRTVEPYGIVAHSGRWYLAAADSIHGEIRTFRLDRVTEPETAPGFFTPPEEFDPAAHVLAGLAETPWHYQVSLRVQGTIEQIRRWLPEGLAGVEPSSTSPTDGTSTAEPDADWYRVQFRAERLDWVATTLAALGLPFIIEEPAALRALITDLARRLIEYADETGSAVI